MSAEQKPAATRPGPFDRWCPECGRYFDLLNETDAANYDAGHDCEEWGTV